MLKASTRSLNKCISLEQDDEVIADAQSPRTVVNRVKGESLVIGDTPGMDALADLTKEGIVRVAVSIKIVRRLVVVQGIDLGIVGGPVGRSQNDHLNNAHLLVTHGNDIRAKDDEIRLSLEKVQAVLVL